MIVKMKKLTVLVSNRNKRESLEELRTAGVLHVKNIKKPLDENVKDLENDIEIADRAYRLAKDTESKKPSLNYKDTKKIIDEVNNIYSRTEELSSKLQSLRARVDWYKEWDNFSLEEVEELRKNNVFLKFYLCPKKKLAKIDKDKLLHIVGQSGDTVYLVFITRNKEARLDFKEVALPEESLKTLKEKTKKATDQIRALERRFKELSQFRNDVLSFRKEAFKRLEFFKVNAGMVSEEEFSYLQGFCPHDSVESVQRLSKKNGWGLVVEEPRDLREPPTLLRNPRWVEIIKPIFNFMGTLPGYNEYDISFWFLVFFSIFFAILVGDAGYGLLFLIATYSFGRKVSNPKAKRPVSLMYVLSVSTIIWGIVTGTYFGYEGFTKLPFLNNLIIKRVGSFSAGNQDFIMYMCFIIGVVQLTIGHLIRTYRYVNSLFAFSQLGWISILWGLFFIVRYLIVGMLLPVYTGYLLLGGALLVIFFSKPQKNIFKAVAYGLGELPLTTINSFSDIVSYVRLFAVGYATVAVASSFNDMALGIGFGSIFKGLVVALILFLGHSLNIILALMSVIVHGIRLNMLEFSNHVNIEWSGYKYEPFSEC